MFQGRILDEYEHMVPEFGLTVVDATLPVEEQQSQVRHIARTHLEGAKELRVTTVRQTYGKTPAGDETRGPGREADRDRGNRRSGRTTQINLLKPWLEELGHAVLDTGMTRSPLAGEGIRRAKEGNNLGRVTRSLFIPPTSSTVWRMK